MPRSRLLSHARKAVPSLIVLAITGTTIAVSATPAAAATPPVITSVDFPDGDAISPMVGEIGELTIDSPDDDIKSYKVFISDDFIEFVEPTALDESVTLSYMPTLPGRRLMTVDALHTDGTGSSTTYSFLVSAKEPVASYRLADAPGAETVSDGSGSNPGRPGAGVELGVPGPKEQTAAAFDGSSEAYIDTQDRNLVPTSKGFAAGAWVKIDDLSRNQTIVSVDGRREAGFVLGYQSTSATTGTWMLEIPDADEGALEYYRVTGGIVNQINHGQWVHVAGVYDAGDKSMKLYLNGQLINTETRPTSWKAKGTVQIGRALDSGRYGRHLDGTLAEVRLHDRVVFADEIEPVGAIEPDRAAYWQLNSDGSEYTGKAPLTFAGDAEIYTVDDPIDPRALTGDGHLALGGQTGYAATNADLVDTRLSFSVTTRVRLSRPVPDRDMTVFALPGQNTNLVEVKYAAGYGNWRLVVAKTDSAIAETVTVDHVIQPTTNSGGQGLSVTYDAFTGYMTLWVQGRPQQLAEPFTASWPTTGIQLGRSAPDSGFFFGAIDDVRVYSGACGEDRIASLAGSSELPDL